MTRGLLIFAWLAAVAGAGCSTLSTILGGPCMDPQAPPDEVAGGYLVHCEQHPDVAAATCCAYGILNERNTSGELCYHVLCRTEECGTFDYVQTVCVPNKEPGVEVQNFTWPSEWEEGWEDDA
jgi:hypothetical protein